MKWAEKEVMQSPFDCHDLREKAALSLEPASRLNSRQRRSIREEEPQTCEHASELSREAVQLLETFPRQQFCLPPHFRGFNSKGALDLFSGSFGAAKALLRAGGPGCYVLNGRDLLVRTC